MIVENDKAYTIYLVKTDETLIYNKAIEDYIETEEDDIDDEVGISKENDVKEG